MTRVTKKNKSSYWRVTRHEKFENPSRLGVLNDRDPDPHISIVQSDRLISNYLMGAWLQFVYVSKTKKKKKTFSGKHFVTRVFFSPEFLHSPFYQLGSRRCADWAKRKLNEIEAGQPDAQTRWEVRGCRQPGKRLPGPAVQTKGAGYVKTILCVQVESEV